MIHPRDGLSLRGNPLHVTQKSLAVLYQLVTRAPGVVTKSELFETVWARRVVTDAALSTCIRELRLVLGDDAREPKFIATVHGKGFRFLLTRDGQTDENSGTATDPGDRNRAAAATSTAAHFDGGQPSVAVLPFQSVSMNPTETVLARGLVTDVIARIARSRAMLVIARGTSLHFEGHDQDVQDIGLQLGVRYVVHGALQIVSNRVRFSMTLAGTETREVLWSEQYERKLSDFLALQEELAGLVVAELEDLVQRHEMQRSSLLPSADLDAWSAYHRGLHSMYLFRRHGCGEAELMFRRSIELEPGVPRPWAGLSFVCFEHVFLGFADDPEDGIRKAFEYAQESLAIDHRDPMGHWALSRAYLLTGDLAASKSSLQTAIDLNPSYAIAQYSLGWVALQLGENQLCLDRVGFAQRLSPRDPLRFAMLGVYALNLAMMNRTEEAVDVSIESLKQPNAHHQALAFAAVTHALDGQRRKAKEYLKRIRSNRPGYKLDDFLSVFRFQKHEDIERLHKAFTDMGAVSNRPDSRNRKSLR